MAVGECIVCAATAALPGALPDATEVERSDALAHGDVNATKVQRSYQASRRPVGVSMHVQDAPVGGGKYQENSGALLYN